MITLFDPFADVTRLRQQINRLVEDSVPALRSPETVRVYRPVVDLFEDEDGLTLRMDLPGVNRESLDIELTGDELTVRGTRPWVADKATCVHNERAFGEFSRSFKVGLRVKNDGVHATYEDGVLSVRIPKADEERPKKVAITLARPSETALA